MRQSKLIIASALLLLAGCSVYEGPADTDPGLSFTGPSSAGSATASNTSASSNTSPSTSSTTTTTTTTSPTATNTSPPDTDDETSSSGTDGPEAEPVEIRLMPPDELTLDAQGISQGEFTLVEVAVFEPGFGMELVRTDLLTAAEEPLVIQAMIGSVDVHSLFLAPAATEVIRLVGYFDASVPDLPPAEFSLHIFGAVAEQTDFTIWLPTTTSSPLCYQVTGMGLSAELADNTDIFCGTDLSATDIMQIRDVVPGAPGSISAADLPLSECTCGTQMQPHGTGSSTGGGGNCSGFTCGDGSCIAANLACNGNSDCLDGSDEDAGMCGNPSSCCVATNGCPEETGSDCGSTCCCCPSAQACCANSADGCCAA